MRQKTPIRLAILSKLPMRQKTGIGGIQRNSNVSKLPMRQKTLRRLPCGILCFSKLPMRQKTRLWR